MDWQETALNRRLWRPYVSEAKTHFGSLCQRKEGKRAAGTPRCLTTPMDISNTRGTADALPAFEMVISSLLEGP
ncbi:hypothetical protein RR46_13908 [Papilio xuthus]|uniref:Uncharacterized protein n=1 Tax=Papilio xuthus TaxID=66420 RepID=A0A194PHA3_PAPXU|nr:hypothetical protein RR46_13908 [Papilio xuthus]